MFGLEVAFGVVVAAVVAGVALLIRRRGDLFRLAWHPAQMDMAGTR
jgi:hypothetical protein